jgi:hypothetical protein
MASRAIWPIRRAVDALVEFGQEVQQGQTEQKRSGKSVEQLDMPGLVEAEPKNARSPEGDAGNEDEIVHNKSLARRGSAALQIICNWTA